MKRRTLFTIAAILPFASIRRKAGFRWTRTGGPGWNRAALSGYSPVSGRRLGMAVEWTVDAGTDEVQGCLRRCRTALAKTLAYEKCGIYDPRGKGSWLREVRPTDLMPIRENTREFLAQIPDLWVG